jgi:hypothetical protein
VESFRSQRKWKAFYQKPTVESFRSRRKWKAFDHGESGKLASKTHTGKLSIKPTLASFRENPHRKAFANTHGGKLLQKRLECIGVGPPWPVGSHLIQALRCAQAVQPGPRLVAFRQACSGLGPTCGVPRDDAFRFAGQSFPILYLFWSTRKAYMLCVPKAHTSRPPQKSFSVAGRKLSVLGWRARRTIAQVLLVAKGVPRMPKATRAIRHKKKAFLSHVESFPILVGVTCVLQGTYTDSVGHSQKKLFCFGSNVGS